MSDSRKRILIVEDSDDDADLVIRELGRSGIDADFRRAATVADVKHAMPDGPWDIVLSDYNLPPDALPEIKQAIREHDEEVPIIVISGSIGEENAVALMREGVADFIYKGNLSRLIPAIKRELAAAAQRIARRESEQRFRDIVEVSGDWIWETDAEHRYTFLSNRFQDAEWANPVMSLGVTPWELAGASLDEDEHWQAHLSDLEAHQTFRNFLFSVVTPAGARHHISLSGVPVFDRNGTFCGYRGTATDQSPVVEAFWRAEEAEALLRDAVESISEGFVIFDADDRLVMANEAFRRLYPGMADIIAPGLAFEDLLRAAVAHGLYLEAKGREEEWTQSRLDDHCRLLDGGVDRLADGRWVLVTERRMSNGGIAGLRTDITALKKAEAQRDHLAYHDATTGLPNQALFADRLAQAIGRSERSGGSVIVACLELISLNDIRDSHGLEAGNSAIREVARRLSAVVEPGESVSHIGGGLFLVLRFGADDGNMAMAAVEALLAPFDDGIDVNGTNIPVRIAVGVSTAPNDASDADAVLRNATTAVRRAKERPGQRYQFYDAEMTNAAISRTTLDRDLRRALDNDELFLAYQPQVNAHTYRLVGAEALVRWQHPTRGATPPCEFIPIAEESGLIVALGEHVLRLACRQARIWRDEGVRIPIAVNLSAVQLSEPSLHRRVFSILQEAGVPPDAIRLELTESAILHDVRAATETMRRLAADGIRFALDDFGMEHSALSHLSDLPFESLKIDRSFVVRMMEGRGHAALLQAIVAMIHSLGMTAIAEGVEQPGQLAYLKAYGCDVIQGFLFSRPVMPQAFAPFLAAGIVRPLRDEPVTAAEKLRTGVA